MIPGGLFSIPNGISAEYSGYNLKANTHDEKGACHI